MVCFTFYGEEFGRLAPGSGHMALYYMDGCTDGNYDDTFAFPGGQRDGWNGRNDRFADGWNRTADGSNR
jgi:hypothetical protein